MQTAAQRPVLPVSSDNTQYYLTMQPQFGGLSTYEYAATSLTFNPASNVVTMNVLTTVSLNTVTMNISSNLFTGSINVATGSNVFVGTTRVESQIPHPFLLSFL
jgi:hypothetical protein